MDQAGEATVTVTQNNASGKLYGCLVEIEVQGPTKSMRGVIDFGVAPASATASVKIPLGEPYISYTLDPDHRLIGKDVTVAPIAPPPKKHIWIL